MNDANLISVALIALIVVCLVISSVCVGAFLSDKTKESNGLGLLGAGLYLVTFVIVACIGLL